MVSNITKRSKSGGIDKVSKWRSPGRNIGVRVSELTGVDMVVTLTYFVNSAGLTSFSYIIYET